MVVHFVDIGGIVDHYCLNFLFIMFSVFFLNGAFILLSVLNLFILFSDQYQGPACSAMSHRHGGILRDCCI